MTYETIIESRVAQFQKENAFDNVRPDSLFEIYVNHLFAKKYRFLNCINEFDLFDLSNVGGEDDSGIDGLFIRLNGTLIHSCSDIDNIVKNGSVLDVELVFIQAKRKTSIDVGELGKFFSGIKNFLSEKPFDSTNGKISEWLAVKDYLFSQAFLPAISSLPKVTAIFAYEGKNLNDVHVLSKIEEFKESIGNLGNSQIPKTEIFDGEALFHLAQEIEQGFEISIPYFESIELEHTEGVSSSLIMLCNAESLLTLLKDNETGQLRRELFKDNVRDYQGETSVNREIYETIKTDPSKFCLLNNGITIVCKSCLSMNRQITLSNPQIVNGCQTCTSLYNASSGGLDVRGVNLIVKVIATGNASVTNAVIKGTNRQNIVYDEAFEITREFHKHLEEYVKSVQMDRPSAEKIYYERRSEQMANMTGVLRHQIFDLGALTQSYVSTFLVEPHCGFEHEIRLLEMFRGELFNDDDNPKTYFTSALLFLRLDRLFKDDYEKYKHYIRYRYQIMALFFHIVAGRVPDLSNRKKTDAYCDKLQEAIGNKASFVNYVDQTISTFESIKQEWIKERGPKFRHSIKDNSLFDSFMFEKIGFKYSKLMAKSQEETQVFTGVVISVRQDRNGFYYGYIKADPVDVFIHQNNSPSIRFSSLSGKTVRYKIISNGFYDKPKGVVLGVLGSNRKHML